MRSSLSSECTEFGVQRISAERFLYRNLILPDSFAWTTAHTSEASFQEKSTVTAPRAFMPRTAPPRQASGNAGKRTISPFWLCKSISAIAAGPPRKLRIHVRSRASGRPVIAPSTDQMSVYLPQNPHGWFDFWTGEHVSGSATLTVGAK